MFSNSFGVLLIIIAILVLLVINSNINLELTSGNGVSNSSSSVSHQQQQDVRVMPAYYPVPSDEPPKPVKMDDLFNPMFDNNGQPLTSVNEIPMGMDVNPYYLAPYESIEPGDLTTKEETYIYTPEERPSVENFISLPSPYYYPLYDPLVYPNCDPLVDPLCLYPEVPITYSYPIISDYSTTLSPSYYNNYNRSWHRSGRGGSGWNGIHRRGYHSGHVGRVGGSRGRRHSGRRGSHGGHR